MKRRKGLLDEEKFLPPLPEQLPRGVSSLPGYGQTSPVAQGLLGFTGRQPTYSVMDPEAQQMSDAYRLGEQASVASQLYGSMLPFAAASTMAKAGQIPGASMAIKEKVFSQIGSKSLQEPVSINPKYLTFREADQGRIEQVRELFPKGEPMNPIVTIREMDGSYSILDGHNRAAVAMERKQKIPMVSVTRKEYEDLNQSGFDDMEISFAALTRANQDEAASDLNRQFSGSDVGGRGMKAFSKLPEYGSAIAGLLSPAVLEYLRRRDEEGM